MVTIWQLLFAILLIIISGLYGRGLRQQPASAGQKWRFAVGIGILSVPLVSPLFFYATQYFALHVLQNIMLVAWAPSLIMSSNPLPVWWAGIPSKWQQTLKQHFPLTRKQIKQATAPPISLFLMASTVWLWYDPQINSWAVQYSWVHALEVTLLFVVSLEHWWHITAVSPRLHKPMPEIVRILYTWMGAAPMKLTGLVIIFSPVGIGYQYPKTIESAGFDITGVQLGGLIIWTIGGFIYTIVAGILMRQWLAKEEAKPALPEHMWNTEEAMMAPGLHRHNSTDF